MDSPSWRPTTEQINCVRVWPVSRSTNVFWVASKSSSKALAERRDPNLFHGRIRADYKSGMWVFELQRQGAAMHIDFEAVLIRGLV